jgi:transposase-like protein
MQTSTWYVIKQRLAWIRMHEMGAPVSRACEQYGISRRSFHKWWRRYQEGSRDFHVLKDRSRRPHRHPRAVPKATVERVLALRRRTRYGPRRMAYYLTQEGYQISVFGAYRVLPTGWAGEEASLPASQEASELCCGRQVPAFYQASQPP